VPEEPVFILFGPTACGKTALLEALFCCTGLSAEIISSDSMQVYRGMNIGTAKPDASLCKRLPHHLIDILEPCEQFNSGDFVRLACENVLKITSRHALPVISGGTGFYINNFINGLPEAPPSCDAIRATLKTELAEKGAAHLMAELEASDPVSASRIHINDEYRLLRALEVTRLTGSPLSSFKVAASCDRKNTLIVGLECNRDTLYERINKRCAAMISAGLYDEVQSLFKKGYTPKTSALKAIGYKEFFDENDSIIKNNSFNIEYAQNLIAKNSRNYAKRQITYFKNIANVVHVSLDNCSMQNVASKIKELILKFMDKNVI
jgi:tRNA dimethylallyltransferase